MIRAMADFIRLVFSSTLAILGTVALVVWLAANVITGFVLPSFVFWGILILSVLSSAFSIYYKQYRQLNPEVDFILDIGECIVLNARLFTPERRFKERGEFEFGVYFEIRNQRQTETEVAFEVVQIETDLPLDMTETDYKPELMITAGSGRADGSKLVLSGSRSVTARLKVTLHISFQKPEKSVRQIGKVTHFRVPFRAIQTDGGASNHYAVLDSPKEMFREVILKEIENWIGHSPPPGAAGGKDIVDYLRWLFDG